MRVPHRSIPLPRKVETEAAPDLTRRGFLRLGTAGTLALGAASLLAPGCAHYATPPLDPAPPRVLDAEAWAVVTAAAPHYVGVDEIRAEIDVARAVDAILAGLDPAAQADALKAITVFERGTILFAFSTRRFTEMSRAGQVSYVDGWRASSLAFRRTVHTLMRGLCLYGYYAQPAAWGAIGYAGPWVGRAPMGTVPLRFPLPDGSVVA